MDIFTNLHPTDPATVTCPEWVVPADSEQQCIIAAWCDADRNSRPSWPRSLAFLVANPVDGRIPA